MNEDEREYYIQLHEAGRHYDTQMWATPGIFFIAQGAVFTSLDFSNIFTWTNGLILLGNALFSFYLWIQFEKNRQWQLLIQNRIDYTDSSLGSRYRIPLYTIIGKNNREKVEQIRIHLKASKSWLIRREWAATRPLSRYISSILLLGAYMSLIMGIFIFVALWDRL